MKDWTNHATPTAERTVTFPLPILRPGVFWLASVAVLASLAGCTPMGVLTHKLVGPPPRPAQYVPAKEPMLVLVENYRNPSAAMLDAEQLARRLSDELAHHKIAPLVAPDRLEAVRGQPDYAKMTIPAVGRAAGAKQVLYVNVRQYTVEGTVAGEMTKGKADMTVRVVDAKTGANRWPTDSSAGHAVTIQTPWLRREEGVNEATLRDRMSRQAATYIVKLFRKHSAEEDVGAGVQ